MWSGNIYYQSEKKWSRGSVCMLQHPTVWHGPISWYENPLKPAKEPQQKRQSNFDFCFVMWFARRKNSNSIDFNAVPNVSDFFCSSHHFEYIHIAIDSCVCMVSMWIAYTCSTKTYILVSIRFVTENEQLSNALSTQHYVRQATTHFSCCFSYLHRTLQSGTGCLYSIYQVSECAILSVYFFRTHQ